MHGRLERWVEPEILKFVVLFIALTFLLTFLIQLSWVDETLVGPYTQFISGVAASVMRAIGFEAVVSGTVIREGSFAVEIRRGCDGLVASILLVSACLAYPFSWKDRLVGTLLGCALIFALNILRIVILFLVGLRGSNEAFYFSHVYVSQFAIIALTMVFWIYWAGRRKPASGT